VLSTHRPLGAFAENMWNFSEKSFCRAAKVLPMLERCDHDEAFYGRGRFGDNKAAHSVAGVE